MASDKAPKKMRMSGGKMGKAEKREESQPTNAPQQIKWKFVCVWKNQVKINWIELSAATPKWFGFVFSVCGGGFII